MAGTCRTRSPAVPWSPPSAAATTFSKSVESIIPRRTQRNLRLGIGMQADYANQNFPGRYTVKVRVERK